MKEYLLALWTLQPVITVPPVKLALVRSWRHLRSSATGTIVVLLPKYCDTTHRHSRHIADVIWWIHDTILTKNCSDPWFDSILWVMKLTYLTRDAGSYIINYSLLLMISPILCWGAFKRIKRCVLLSCHMLGLTPKPRAGVVLLLINY